MKILLFLIVLCVFSIGIVVGMIAKEKIIHKHKTKGILKVDYTDPDGPYLFLELDTHSFERIEKEEYIILKIEINNTHV